MFVLMLISAALVISCVIFHGISLQVLASHLFRKKKFSFSRISLFIFTVIISHLLQILLFTAVYVLLAPHPDFGCVTGVENPGVKDLYYFSAVTYTTTGYGDLTPTGNLRLLATIEALTGMIMVAWTASAAFLIMHRYWLEQNPDRAPKSFLDK